MSELLTRPAGRVILEVCKGVTRVSCRTSASGSLKGSYSRVLQGEYSWESVRELLTCPAGRVLLEDCEGVTHESCRTSTSGSL